MAKQQRILLIILSACLLVGLLSTVFLVSAQGTFGTGWTGQYFNNPTLQGSPVYTEALPSGINLNFGTGSPNAAVPVDNFSARYDSVQLFNAGTYEFVAASDDGVRVFVDNVLVLDRFVRRVLTYDRFQLTLTAGAHALRVEYFEEIDQAVVQFSWLQLNAPTPTFSAGLFVTPFGTPGVTPTVYTGPLATVRGARGLALRTGPYLGASYVTTLIQDNSYPVLARNQDEGVYNWYLLQVGDRRGWASGRYLEITQVDPAALPLQGSVFDDPAIVNITPYGVATTRAVMVMRNRPTTRSPRIGTIPWGGQAEVLGRTIQAGIDRWYLVRYQGMVGWIAAPWVRVTGERYNIPIR